MVHVDRRMKEPEDPLTQHGIKRVLVVLLILRILLAVGTQEPQSGVLAKTIQVGKWYDGAQLSPQTRYADGKVLSTVASAGCFSEV